ncbi:hypothetical protein AVEN_267336-1 [Araneus ventricosus]|uniref:Uncharacterized protein n=1 Tax=Araneus ventricosus TaxID=182803 RepID=A0A4Y2DL74_ARAVE|nr:hypothetical protein AVEN_267336-1 [Araneus ventricosus]
MSSLRQNYSPTARRKTLSRAVSNRRVEERRDTDIKSTATFGKVSALPLGEENEMRLPPVLNTPNERKPFPSPPKCSGISRFYDNRHRYVWCLGFFSWRFDSTTTLRMSFRIISVPTVRPCSLLASVSLLDEPLLSIP